MKLGWQPRKWLTKKARTGFRGWPVGTVAFYGPDNSRASKVAVGIKVHEGAEIGEPARWFSETGDVRTDEAIAAAIVEYLRAHDVRTVAMSSGIIGCPHEEGIDYPEGEVCPACPYWAGRDRFANL
jgi:hypothetical protein